MKVNYYKLLLIGFLFMATSSLAQLVSISNNGTQPDKLTTCQDKTFSVILNFASAQSVPTNLNFDLDEGMELISGSANVVLINDSTLQLPTASAGNIIVDYTIRPVCGFFSATTISNVNHIIELDVNGVVQTSNLTTTYSVDAPYLIFRPDLSYRLNYNLADYGVSYTRRFVYVNTGNPDFNGSISFFDTVRKNANLASIQLQNIQVLHPAYGSGSTLLNSTLTDTSALINFNVQNLATGDSIVIEETVVVTGCVIEDSYTDYSLNYGCYETEICEQVELAPTTSALLDQNKKPLIIKNSPFSSGYNKILEGYDNCLYEPHARILEIRNLGNGAATNVRFTAFGVSYSIAQGFYSKIDTNSIEVYTLNGSNQEIPVPFHKIGMVSTTYNSRNLYQQKFLEYETDEILPANGVIYIRYNELVECFEEADYSLLFNTPYRISNAYIGAYLNHPCYPTDEYYVDPRNAVNYGGGQHLFNFAQALYNLDHPAVTDQEEIWLEVEDNRYFTMGHSNYVGFAFNLDSSELLVRLKLEPGFEAIEDSIFLVSTQAAGEVKWFPYLIDYDATIISGNADGGYAVAHFAFPDSFYVDPNTVVDPWGIIRGLPYGNTKRQYYGNKSNPTPAYYEFFNDFKVKFKLRAYCVKAENSISTVTQELFFVPNKYCDPTCRMPMSSVSDKIKFLCPGCILPGFNVTQFDINRTNLGYADNDNNHLPDQLPYTGTTPDENLVEKKHFLIGDTMQIDLSAITSDGEIYRFDNIGIDLDHGRVFISSPFLKNLKFIGATGTFRGQSFTIPATATEPAVIFSDATFALPNVNPDVFSIDVGVAAMTGYGITGFTKFEYLDEIQIHPQFVVVKNLDQGSGANVRYSVEELNAFVYMSGEAFTGYRQRTDANELLKPEPTDNYGILNFTERENLDYWCTGGIGRLLGVGVSFSLYDNAGYSGNNLNYAGYGIKPPAFPNFPSNNPCFKTMMQGNYVGIGETSGSYYYPYQTQGLLDAFPYELRNLWKKEKVEVNYPDNYYEVDRIFIDMGQLLYDPNGNAHGYDRYIVEVEVAGNPNITQSPSNMQLNLLPYYKQSTNQVNENGYMLDKDSLLRFDEGIINDVFFIFKMKDCAIPDSVNIGGYEMKQYFSDFIFAEGRDTVIKTTYSPNNYFDKPSAELEFDPFNATSTDGNWTATMSTVNPFVNNTQNYVNNVANNSFVYFESPNGSITVNTVQNNGTTLTPAGTINGLPLYGLGKLGANAATAKELISSLSISSTFNCANVDERDSLRVIFGWNCYGYPATLEEACFLDTAWLYIDILETGLQPTLVGSNSIGGCEEQEYSLLLHPTGTGDIANLQVGVNLPDGVSYVLESAKITQGSQEELVEPEGTAPNLNWDLDSISFLTDHFSSADQDVYLTFKLSGGCFTDSRNLEIIVNATNYCGKALTEITLNKPITGNPATSASILDIDESGICEGTETIGLTIFNGNSGTINLNLYSSATNELLGNLTIADVPHNTTDTYSMFVTSQETSLYFVWQGCACTDTVYFDYDCPDPCAADASFTVANVCKGDTILPMPTQLDGTHSWTYSYFGLTSSAVHPEFPAGTNGVYTITHTVTSACGEIATSTQQVTVFLPEFTSIQYIGSSPLCEGDVAIVTVANADHFVGFDWNTGQTTPEIEITSGGYFHVNVTDANGCVSYCSSITVTEIDRPDDFNQTVYLCLDGEITLDAGAGYGSYLWSNGATTQTITVNAAGTYTVTICSTASATCCGQGTFNVLTEDYTFVMPDFNICAEGTVEITSPITGSGYTYTWYKDGVVTTETNPTLIATAAGIYSLEVTTDHGCTFGDDFNIYEIPDLQAEFTSSVTTACIGEQICFTALNQAGNNSTQWSFTQNGVTTQSSDLAPCVSFTETGMVEVIYTISNECDTWADTQYVNIINIASFTQTLYLCGNSGTVTLDAGAGYGSYDWSGGEKTQSIDVNTPGTYTVTYCSADAPGCCGVGTFIVVLEDLSFEMPDARLCIGETIDLTSPLIGNGYTYTWYLGAYPINGPGTNSTITVSNTGEYLLQVTTDHGCTFSDNFSVTNIPSPSPDFTTSSSLACIGGEQICFIPSTDGVLSYDWSFTQNGSTIHSYEEAPCLSFTQVGTVEVVLTVTNECGSWSSSQKITIVEPQESCIEIIGTNPMCPGSSITLTVNGSPTTTNWYDQYNKLIGTGTSIKVTESGVYTVVTTDINGCTSTCCTFIEVIKYIPEDFPDVKLCAPQTVTHGIHNGTGVWSNGFTGTTQTFGTSGSYYVDITTVEGCTYRDEFEVTVFDPSADITVVRGTGVNRCKYTISAANIVGSGLVFNWYIDGVWQSNSPSFVYTHSGSETTANITLELYDANGCKKAVKLSYTFFLCIGKLSDFGPKFIVVPNPFTDVITVTYEISQYPQAELRLVDMTNHVVFVTVLNTQDTEIIIPTQALTAGMYMTQIYSGNTLIESQRIVKIK